MPENLYLAIAAQFNNSYRIFFRILVALTQAKRNQYECRKGGEISFDENVTEANREWLNIDKRMRRNEQLGIKE